MTAFSALFSFVTKKSVSAHRQHPLQTTGVPDLDVADLEGTVKLQI